eukprot:481758-Alexandrium_andersonii.AAC.1
MCIRDRGGHAGGVQGRRQLADTKRPAGNPLSGHASKWALRRAAMVSLSVGMFWSVNAPRKD